MADKPPQADDQTRNQIADAAAKDPQGQHQGGQDTSAAPKVKTEKERMWTSRNLPTVISLRGNMS